MYARMMECSDELLRPLIKCFSATAQALTCVRHAGSLRTEAKEVHVKIEPEAEVHISPIQVLKGNNNQTRPGSKIDSPQTQRSAC